MTSTKVLPPEARPLALSIVAPTFNEAGNIVPLRDRIAAALGDVAWELIFVDDDSPDDTAAIAHRLAQSDRRVRCLLRVGRRGLVSAACEGILSSSAPLVAVIDADLQHDESLLAAMLEAMRDDRLDIVVGSRYVAGGGVGEWSRARALTSRVATRLSRLVLRADLQDPMSGFFMIRRDAALRAIRAGPSGVGF
jgi:dolichol-phosphate mannosyltransferase